VTNMADGASIRHIGGDDLRVRALSVDQTKQSTLLPGGSSRSGSVNRVAWSTYDPSQQKPAAFLWWRVVSTI